MSQKGRKNGIALDLCHSRLLFGAHQCMVRGAASSASAHTACVAVSGADGCIACVAVSVPPPRDSHGARHRWGRYRVPRRRRVGRQQPSDTRCQLEHHARRALGHPRHQRLRQVDTTARHRHSGTVKVPPWQRPSSAPAPPQGAPGGSGQLGTPRKRPCYWALRHCLGCSS